MTFLCNNHYFRVPAILQNALLVSNRVLVVSTFVQVYVIL